MKTNLNRRLFLTLLLSPLFPFKKRYCTGGWITKNKNVYGLNSIGMGTDFNKTIKPVGSIIKLYPTASDIEPLFIPNSKKHRIFYATNNTPKIGIIKE